MSTSCNRCPESRQLRGVDIDRLNKQLEAEDDFAAQAALLMEIDTYRTHRLELGAVGLLMILGKPVDVIPLDDEKLMEAADPTKNGFRLDTPENSAREAEMVRRLLKGGPVSAVVLGSAHDLRDELKAKCPGCRVEVIAPKRLDRMNSVER